MGLVHLLCCKLLYHLLGTYSGNYGSLFLIKKSEFYGEQKKESVICMIEKSVPQDHRLSSLHKPCDAKR